LPLKYEDGPDFCTVTFATGAAFALTVHPERMKLMEAALSAAPVAQEPVAWVEFTEAGLIRFWTSDPARAEAERTRRSLTKFTLSELIALVGRPRTPPATPAGLGADEIARVFVRWKQSKNLHESLAAQNIEKELLALLSRGSGDQSHSTHEA